MLFLGPLFVVGGIAAEGSVGPLALVPRRGRRLGPPLRCTLCRANRNRLRPEPEARRERRFRLTLGALVALRLAIPLVTLAFSGHALPGLPAYRYRPLNGDSFGFYSATREFIASIGRVSKPFSWRSSPSLPRSSSPSGSGAAARRVASSRSCCPRRGLARADAADPPDGAARRRGVRLAASLGDPDDPDQSRRARPVTRHRVRGRLRAHAGRARRRCRRDGLRRPLRHRAALHRPRRGGPLRRLAARQRTDRLDRARNGQWNVDVGLHLYTEPLSTALVVASVALLLRPATQQLGRAGAGLAIGYATAVKLTNGVVGAVLAVLVAWRHGWRQALPYAAGALVSAPIVIAYWPKGYVGMFDGATSATPASLVALVRRRRLAALAPLHAAAPRAARTAARDRLLRRARPLGARRRRHARSSSMPSSTASTTSPRSIRASST